MFAQFGASTKFHMDFEQMVIPEFGTFTGGCLFDPYFVIIAEKAKSLCYMIPEFIYSPLC